MPARCSGPHRDKEKTKCRIARQLWEMTRVWSPERCLGFQQDHRPRGPRYSVAEDRQAEPTLLANSLADVVSPARSIRPPRDLMVRVLGTTINGSSNFDSTALVGIHRQSRSTATSSRIVVVLCHKKSDGRGACRSWRTSPQDTLPGLACDHVYRGRRQFVF